MTGTLPFPHVVGLSDAERTLLVQGDQDARHPLASVSKPIATLGALVAIDRGLLSLEDPAGPEGATIRHLLAHAAGYAFDSEELLAAPGRRRIYSSTGFEILGLHLEDATGQDLATYMEQAVVRPLGLSGTDVHGSPGAGYHGTVRDLLTIGRELLRPTLISAELLAEATRVQFPGLAGVLPGYGRQDPNDWGLGFEIRALKRPHWTGEESSPETFGHFGQSGSFLWVDPERGLAAAFLGAESFGEAHRRAWPGLTDGLLRRAREEGWGR